MEVRETLFERSFSVDTEDPYGTAADFMQKLSAIGLVYERKNIYMTDGPVKKTVLVFDLVETLDSFSRVIINFAMDGENKILYVNILGEFVLKIQDSGFFSEVFTDFYLHNVFPVLRKVSEKRVKELNQSIEKL